MRWLWLSLIVLSIAATAQAVDVSQTEIANRRCLACHGQSRLADLSPDQRIVMVAASTRSSTQPATPPPKRPGLYLGNVPLETSVHAKLACVQCHTNAQTLPHPQTLGRATCDSSCHSGAQSDFLQGAHAEAVAKGDPNAPTCTTCHGGHDILHKSDRNSRSHPLNIVKICGDCHSKHRNGHDDGAPVAKYLESVHGKAVVKGGLAVAATCADCHANHRVLPAKNTRSTVNRENVAKTCGRCHVGLYETYQASVHGEELAKGNAKAPVCSDCHTAHAITRTDTPRFMLDIVAECGRCHDKPLTGSNSRASLYETYRRSYHGQVNKLGSTRAARCSDCHGAHDIKRPNEPGSRLAGENRIEACRQCHKGADVKFAAFAPHADFHDAKRFPLLHGVWLYFVIMMSAAFGFFGLHSLLWFMRSIIDRIRHGPHPRPAKNGTAIRRFNKVDRVNHAFVILSFFGLALTGLPQIYSDKHWAQTLAGMFGGVQACRVLHRTFALVLIGNFAVHFVGLARRVKRLSLKAMLCGPLTMMPRVKDFKDCFGMWRWFFKGGSKPRFDRWTYWEKFDYVAEVGGSMIIGLSGLLLWFPLFFSQYLPGWWFNVAKIVHGYEALLAVGFIFTIHFFNAHVRLEKFPVDDVMFTGSLPEEELKHERGEEYDRLAASGELEKLRVPTAPKWQRRIAVAVGIGAMAIGTTIVVLIILAGLNVI